MTQNAVIIFCNAFFEFTAQIFGALSTLTHLAVLNLFATGAVLPKPVSGDDSWMTKDAGKCRGRQVTRAFVTTAFMSLIYIGLSITMVVLESKVSTDLRCIRSVNRL